MIGTATDHGVPHDLIVDILLKLPIKSLLRFKYVSKQWFWSITDPDFVDRHLSEQKKKDSLFVTYAAESVDSINRSRRNIFMDSMVVNRDTDIRHYYAWMVGVPLDDHYDMVNSCDGILCFHGNINMFLYNPATKEYRLLPTGPSCHYKRLGFGRDLVTKRYKIVILFYPIENKLSLRHLYHDVCVVFTLDPNPNSCTWRTIGAVPYKIHASSRSVHANGAIYWFMDETCHPNMSEVIIMFDLHTEKFKPIPYPDSCSHEQRRIMQLECLRDCLWLAQREPGNKVSIWIMQQEQQKITWEKLYCILLEADGVPRFTFAEYRDGTLLVCTKDRIYLYKQNTEIPCTLNRFTLDRSSPWVTTAFTESLVPLYGRTLSQFRRSISSLAFNLLAPFWF